MPENLIDIYKRPRLSRLRRALEIFRWYPKTQLWIRAMKLITQRLRGGRFVKPKSLHREPNNIPLESYQAVFGFRRKQWAKQWSSSESLEFQSGVFTLLNERKLLGSMPFDAESLVNASHLWRFQFQYHEFLLRYLAHADSQSATAVEECKNRIWEFLKNWIDHYNDEEKRLIGDAWHPYCLSRRIPVWCQLLSTQGIFEQQRERLIEQIAYQGACLEKNLELDIRGNHLLENIRALAYVYSCVYSNADAQSLSRLFRLLDQEAAAQVLSSGEHFERSPMYHCQATWIFLEVAWLYKDIDSKIATFCQGVASRMIGHLQEICHPDGEIPLFSDSCFDEAPGIESIFNLAQGVGLKCELNSQTQNNNSRQDSTTDQSSYWIHEQGDNKTIVDIGVVAASDLPAHGHCDLGTFEMSLDGQRIITDSGIHDYSGSVEHQFCKSSIAHNIMTIDDTDCCVVWDKFRMGFRGAIVDKEVVGDSNLLPHYISFAHNGYERLGCLKLNRVIGHLTANVMFCIDHCKWRQRADVLDRTSHLHFHPDTKVEQVSDARFDLETEASKWQLTIWGADNVETKNGIYCPAFGKKITRMSLRMIQLGDVRPLGWVLSERNLGNKLDVQFEKDYFEIDCEQKQIKHYWK